MAYGGTGGAVTGGGVEGFTGNAAAHAVASSGGYASATSNAQGGLGSSLVAADSTATGVGSSNASALASLASTQLTASAGFSAAGAIGSSETKATISQPAVTGGSGVSPFAYGTALPQNSDVNAALAGNPNVQQDFSVGGSSQIWLLGQLGTLNGASDGTFASHTSSLNLTLDTSSIAPQHLLVGLLDPVSGSGVLGAGDSLTFNISLGGTQVLSQTFSSLGSANAYFDDHTLDLGDWSGYVSGNTLTAAFSLSLNTQSQFAGLNFGFIAGNSLVGSGAVPLPAAVWLFASALAGLAVIGRRTDKNAA